MNSGDDVLSLLLLNIDTSYAGQKATYKLLAPKGQVPARSGIAGQCYPAPPLPVRIKTSCFLNGLLRSLKKTGPPLAAPYHSYSLFIRLVRGDVVNRIPDRLDLLSILIRNLGVKGVL